MLNLVGAGHAHSAVKSFSIALEKIYSGSAARSAEVVAKQLIVRASAAINAISPQVIRHSIDDLPDEKDSLGVCEEWKFEDPVASSEELELMLRMDRLLRIAKNSGMNFSGATNDPRFHVGWQHFDLVVSDLMIRAKALHEPEKSLIQNHLRHIKKLRIQVGEHSKILAVAKEVVSIVNQGEKVVIFCHHIATAQELTLCLAPQLPSLLPLTAPAASVWETAWQDIFEGVEEAQQNPELRNTYIHWLCSDMIRAQTQSWFTSTPRSCSALVKALQQQPARHPKARKIASAAISLFQDLLSSKSGKAVLREAANYPELMPGAAGANVASRVLGVCEPNGDANLFVRNNQPDTVIKVFGSPFGPDVLVVTDKLSEGIDLHAYCRHLIHYELDPSPIRTVQRNGRIRRVNSWASVTGGKIRYAYPAFGGTRDQRLVEIMKKRVATFSLLLGGVSDFEDADIDLTTTSDENWRSAVVQHAQRQLKNESAKLVACKPGKLKNPTTLSAS
jgi:hypothetical protein